MCICWTSSSYSSFPAHHDAVDRRTDPNKMFWAEEILFNIQQAERPLEHCVEEFLSVVHLVSWSDAMINACFQMGLNDDNFCSITPDDCCKPKVEFINYVFALCNSNYYVNVEDSNLPPICKHAAAPAHQQPVSSTCCSNELAPSGPPSLTPVLLSSSLILSPEPAASSRTPAAAAASSWPPTAVCSRTRTAARSQTPATACSQTPAAAHSRTPATPPHSGLPAVNMASQINIKDIMDLCGLFIHLSPLVPSSSPKSPLVPSMPPECPPEPELPPEHPGEPELPPELLQSLSCLQKRPPMAEPPSEAGAGSEHPPVPAPPERPPVSMPPKLGLPVLSWADNALSSPKKTWLDCLPDPPCHYGLYVWSWLPELPDCMFVHGFPPRP
ncbi:hypothetical protein M9458_008672 [Cirrhinus mrigala]|uniref:Uncharacterized protein n=1 Tax=Cirrhinus mrigala TaxID=683832 RepID=A0ABD0RAM8_CIRMR